MVTNRPDVRPERVCFSSGPCAKPRGWSPECLASATVGRSHRSPLARGKLRRLIGKMRLLLEIPDEYRIGIMPASDTGALEAAMWSLLGPRPVEMLAWDVFGADWLHDAIGELGLTGERGVEAHGTLPDLAGVDFDRDVVFAWNGTTSGVRVPNGDFIPLDRQGITICDATSAVLACHLPWERLDATTFSWQKVLGGEAAHGVLILSPRAVERLETHRPSWPVPKIFRLVKNGKLIEGIFDGATINTPSMLCVEDCLFALDWVDRMGGLPATIARSDASSAAIAAFVDGRDWIDFVALDPATRSNTSVCLKFVAPNDALIDGAGFARSIAKRLESEGVALDIAAHRNAPPGLRIWCGATVETADVEALLPWIDWAYRAELAERGLPLGTEAA